MDNLLHVKSQYAMLMNAKGRVMFDILMYQMEKDEIFIECDRSIAEKVRKHLSMYKIRRKVKVEHLSSHPVGHIFDNSEDVNDGVFIDPRVGNFGKRSLIGNVNNVETECLENYHSKRYQFGIAEGHEEIIFDKSFPLESNLGMIIYLMIFFLILISPYSKSGL
jgi:folate-binding Fe-S cluster repair protein YgfZ